MVLFAQEIDDTHLISRVGGTTKMIDLKPTIVSCINEKLKSITKNEAANEVKEFYLDKNDHINLRTKEKLFKLNLSKFLVSSNGNGAIVAPTPSAKHEIFIPEPTKDPKNLSCRNNSIIWADQPKPQVLSLRNHELRISQSNKSISFKKYAKTIESGNSKNTFTISNATTPFPKIEFPTNFVSEGVLACNSTNGKLAWKKFPKIEKFSFDGRYLSLNFIDDGRTKKLSCDLNNRASKELLCNDTSLRLQDSKKRKTLTMPTVGSGFYFLDEDKIVLKDIEKKCIHSENNFVRFLVNDSHRKRNISFPIPKRNSVLFSNHKENLDFLPIEKLPQDCIESGFIEIAKNETNLVLNKKLSGQTKVNIGKALQILKSKDSTSTFSVENSKTNENTKILFPQKGQPGSVLTVNKNNKLAFQKQCTFEGNVKGFNILRETDHRLSFESDSKPFLYPGDIVEFKGKIEKIKTSQGKEIDFIYKQNSVFFVPTENFTVYHERKRREFEVHKKYTSKLIRNDSANENISFQMISDGFLFKKGQKITTEKTKFIKDVEFQNGDLVFDFFDKKKRIKFFENNGNVDDGILSYKNGNVEVIRENEKPFLDSVKTKNNQIIFQMSDKTVFQTDIVKKLEERVAKLEKFLGES